MAVPSSMTDLSVSEASNSPADSDTVTAATRPSDYMRALGAILRRPFAKGADVASATAANLGSNTDGDYFHVTGTTGLAASNFGTVSAGVERTIVFDGALTLTHNATSFILPGGADITSAAGDVAVFRSEGSGNWKCTSYVKASGAPVGSYQPLDADLTAIAALTTTAYGRALLELADAAALRTAVGAASESATGVVELATPAEAAAGTDTARATTAAGVAAAIAALGLGGSGQTWQDVSASRAVSPSTYTNSTGKPIVAVISIHSTTGFALTATVAGVTIALGSTSASGEQTNGTFVIPNGAVYSVTVSAGTPTITGWVELR